MQKSLDGVTSPEILRIKTQNILKTSNLCELRAEIQLGPVEGDDAAGTAGMSKRNQSVAPSKANVIRPSPSNQTLPCFHHIQESRKTSPSTSFWMSVV